MATTNQITLQSNIKTHDKDDLTKYALFLGGTNVAHEVLQSYDPLRIGYGRLFMARKPVFLIDPEKGIPNKFKHIIEIDINKRTYTGYEQES